MQKAYFNIKNSILDHEKTAPCESGEVTSNGGVIGLQGGFESLDHRGNDLLFDRVTRIGRPFVTD